MSRLPSPRLETGDIQGGVLIAYSRLGFPHGRHLLFHFADAAGGRGFVEALRHRVTTALPWAKRGAPPGPGEVPRPEVTLNLAFTFNGLWALGVPTRTLRGLPDEFIDGMAARAAILGDDVLDNTPDHWDPVWQPAPQGPAVHMLAMLSAQDDGTGRPVEAFASLTEAILAEMPRHRGVRLMEGFRGADRRWQDLHAIFENGEPTRHEHFGFVDAIGDPVFLGQYPDGAEHRKCRGQGAVNGKGEWRPIATGEFLLGWPDEAQEIPGAAMPLDFSRNGTFFAYRKLHQHIDRWDRWVEQATSRLMAVWAIDNREAARELLLGKMAGRWRDGVPLVVAPTLEAWDRFNREHPPGSSGREAKLTDFAYGDDPQGIACPVTAHIRRANTRDMLDPWPGRGPKLQLGSALNDRRRLLRRGLPYGAKDDRHGEHGIILLAHCASIMRQFEFVQQQWMHYGLDFNAGNDSCPIVGHHGPGSRFVIAADPGSGKPPFIASGLEQFVSTRGGDYFFVPSLTALRMISVGLVDPT